MSNVFIKISSAFVLVFVIIINLFGNIVGVGDIIPTGEKTTEVTEAGEFEIKTGRVDDDLTEQTYVAKIESRNRTSDSVEVRLVYKQTIKAPYYSEYEYNVKFTAGGKFVQKIAVPFGTWKKANGTDSDRSCEVATDWITVTGITPEAQSVPVKVVQWMENYNGTDLGEGVNIAFNAKIPTYC